MWKKKSYFIWQNIFENAIREEKETEDLSKLQNCGLKDSEKYSKVFTYFSNLSLVIVKKSCDELKKQVNFYLTMGDYCSASVPIRQFKQSIRKLYYFDSYAVLKAEDKKRLSTEVSKKIHDYIKALKEFFRDSDAIDCLFECESCLQRIKSYE